jgi:ubiquinone/menaquinone biosynthesis C-methylase UbiE
MAICLFIPMTDAKRHWETIYKTKSSKEVSWYSPHLKKSFELILSLGLPKNAAIIDVGGGTSTLPDDLLTEGFKNMTVLDISSEALEVSKSRLGDKAQSVQWVESDVTNASLKSGWYDLWHDRAVFHFLTKPEDRKKYINNLGAALKPGGYVLMATFGSNGPLKCSGLEIVRYSAENLKKELGEAFELEKHFTEIHKTPFDSTQEFLYCLFRKN